MTLKLSHSLPLPPSVSPSVCSCVTESVTPQQEVKEGELEAGRERWREGEGAKVQHRIGLDSRREQRANVWQRRKRRRREKSFCLRFLVRATECESVPITASLCVSHCANMCVCSYLCVCVCVRAHRVGCQAAAAGKAFLCSPVINKWSEWAIWREGTTKHHDLAPNERQREGMRMRG